MDETVYDACNGNIKHKHHKKNDLPASADEVLAERLDFKVPIPLKSREELSMIAHQDNLQNRYDGDLLPDIDLKVLHYYASQVILQRFPALENRLDETALLTMGLLVEQWIEEFLTSAEPSLNDLSEINNNDDSTASITKIRSGPADTVSKYVDYERDPTEI